MMNVVGAPSHINVGNLIITNTLTITIGSEWMVQNSDTQNRTVMLGMEMRERKFGLPDTTWCLVTNAGRVVDLVSQETGGQHGIIVEAPNPFTVRALNTLLLPNGLFVPGPMESVAMQDFWVRHSGANFNWIVKVLELDPTTGALLRTIATHEFSDAFAFSL